jgi:hypothetical protein
MDLPQPFRGGCIGKARFECRESYGVSRSDGRSQRQTRVPVQARGDVDSKNRPGTRVDRGN